MIQMIGILLAVGSSPLPKEAVVVHAKMPSGKLDVGKEYAFEIKVSFDRGLSASKSGIPAPILQIDVPPSVKLTGRVFSTYRQLSKNEFLQEPFERLLKKLPARIGFRLKTKPKPDEQFHLNLLAYVHSSSQKTSHFVRRRLALPLVSGAAAVQADDPSSHWGTEDLLQLGDTADSFVLPRADGSKVALEDYIGKKNVIVTTYRAFW